jgi:hypothetical protein
MPERGANSTARKTFERLQTDILFQQETTRLMLSLQAYNASPPPMAGYLCPTSRLNQKLILLPNGTRQKTEMFSALLGIRGV